MSATDTECESLFRVGSVVGYTDRGLIIDVSLGNACQRCAEGRGCGVGVLSRPRQQRMTVFPDDRLSSLPTVYPLGSEVTIALPKRQMHRLTLLVYAMPLLLALLAAGVASLFDVREWLSATLFFCALMGSLSTLKYRMRERMERFRPRLVS